MDHEYCCLVTGLLTRHPLAFSCGPANGPHFDVMQPMLPEEEEDDDDGCWLAPSSSRHGGIDVSTHVMDSFKPTMQWRGFLASSTPMDSTNQDRTELCILVATRQLSRFITTKSDQSPIP